MRGGLVVGCHPDYARKFDVQKQLQLLLQSSRGRGTQAASDDSTDGAAFSDELYPVASSLEELAEQLKQKLSELGVI